VDEPPRRRPVVTLAALYGAGGTVVGPRVAERLGVEFVDRDVPRAVAAASGLPESAVTQLGNERRTRLDRLAAGMSRLSTVTGEGGGAMERLDIQEGAVRAYIEEVLARSCETGGVILGRGGMVVLQSTPGVLHVHLRGPREARVRQAAAVLGIDEDAAARRQRSADDARMGYVSRMYGVDGLDSSLYHLVLDSTVLSLDTCVGLIVTAATARMDSLRADDR
jgi:cytidylate kinase